MNLENLKRMSASELDEYAKFIGINVDNLKKASSKIEAIERKRNKIVVIKAAGLELEVEAKRIDDKRVTDVLSALNAGTATDEMCQDAMAVLLGEKQMEEVAEACVDADGMYDTTTLAYIFTKIITSNELKKY